MNNWSGPGVFDPAKPIVTIFLLAVTAVLLACEGPDGEGGGGSFFGDESVGTTTIAVTIKFSDFGKAVVIEAPEVKPAATPISVVAQPVPTATTAFAPLPSPTPTRAPAEVALEAPARRDVTPVVVVVTSAAWTGTGSMGTARRNHTATLLQDGKVLIVGWSQSAEIYDPANGAFTVIGGTPVNHGQGSTATRLTDGRVLIVGGTGAQQAAEVYDPATGFFAPTGSLNAVHSFHSATLLLDGRVLVAGGQDNEGSQTHAVAEIYDPATGTFSVTGSLNEHRSAHAAALLSNGKVLIVGGTQTTPGQGFGTCLDSAEVYDPAAGAFTAVANMASPRCGPVWTGAVVLNDRKVLITGGASMSAELFDPATETFRATGNMTTPRSVYTATLLPNGHVLLSGGYDTFGIFTTDSAELYDPVTESFSATLGMIEARQQHTATLLPDEQVLVAGGFAGDKQLASAELFSLVPPKRSPTATPAEPLATPGLTPRPAPVATAVVAPSPNPAPTPMGAFVGNLTTTPTASPFRDFEITLYQGEDELGGPVVRHSDLLKIGKPIVLNFWSAGLPTSRTQLPDLERLHQEYGDRITLLAVDIGGLIDLGTDADAVELLRELDVTASAGRVSDDLVLPQFEIFALPTTLFIRPDGRIQSRWTGVANFDVLAESTNKLLIGYSGPDDVEKVSISPEPPTPAPEPPATPAPTPTPAPVAVPIQPVSIPVGDITTVAGNGVQGFSGDGGAAISASLNFSSGVALDASGNLFIADRGNNRIRRLEASTGVIITVAGNGTADFSGDGAAATSASLNGPEGVAVDSLGNLFIADSRNHRVRRVDSATGVITTVAGSGPLSEAGGFSGDGGAATSARLSIPLGVAVDRSGNLFIADFVNNRIRRVDGATGVIITVAGNGARGFSGDGGAATGASLDSPNGVAVDSSGNLYIADRDNHRIRRVDASTKVITTVAGSGPVGFFAGGFSGDGSAATSASLNLASGVALDALGNLFVADQHNQRIRRVDASTGVITTVAGNGVQGFSGDGAAATGARLLFPEGVALDNSGNLFIADRNGHRIREVHGVAAAAPTPTPIPSLSE